MVIAWCCSTQLFIVPGFIFISHILMDHTNVAENESLGRIGRSGKPVRSLRTRCQIYFYLSLIYHLLTFTHCSHTGPSFSARGLEKKHPSLSPVALVTGRSLSRYLSGHHGGGYPDNCVSVCPRSGVCVCGDVQ